jgi:hypothetical protein
VRSAEGEGEMEVLEFADEERRRWEGGMEEEEAGALMDGRPFEAEGE